MVAAGDIIGGRYELLEKLTEGGMGTVWLAHHSQLDIDIAVKVISGKITPALAERFRREAQAAAKLGGPNIVRVLDYGVYEEQPYLVMELLRGQDLETRLRERGTVDPEGAARILRDVSRGVQLAHNAGIVHRDLKPANVFLEVVAEMEIAKVLDFGIAKILQAETDGSLTGEGTIGSPLYMSPEQILGDAVDFRSDIWSLGVVTFEMLTGHNPFSADRLAKIYEKVTRSEIPLATELNPRLPLAINPVLSRALSRDPAKRHESARELAVHVADALGCRNSLMPSMAEIDLRPSLLPFAGTQVGSAPSASGGKTQSFSSFGGKTTQAANMQLAGAAPRAESPRGRYSLLLGTVALLLGSGLAVSLGVVLGRSEDSHHPASANNTPATSDFAPAAVAQAEGNPAATSPSVRKGETPTEDLPNAECFVAEPAPPCGHKLFIDDMEDNDGFLCALGGRTGFWTVFHDGTSELNPKRGDVKVTSVIPDCRGRSARALHVSGKGFKTWGAGVAAKLSSAEGVLFDLSKFRGINFWARSDISTEVQVAVAVRDTLDATYGGGCEAPAGSVCNDHFGSPRILSDKWVAYRVRFDELKQGGWGVPAQFSLTQVSEIHFQVKKPEGVASVDVDFWLDDLALVQ